MKGKIIIDKELCKGCGYCITACPKRLIVLDSGFNAMSYHPAALVNIDKCNGCGLCAAVCPDIVIEVYREVKTVQTKKDI
jgi:2-oxoglutarate ferredoxin oxidoreductase subunit delta